MDDFREWIITYILDEIKLEDELEPTYKYTNLECWNEYSSKKMAYKNLITEIENRPEEDPLDILVYEMDKMLRCGYKAIGEDAKQMFMTAYYTYEYLMTLLTEVEWSVEIVEGD